MGLDPKVGKALRELVAAEVRQFPRDADTSRRADLLEELTSALALTVSAACEGNAAAANEMLEGVSQYLFTRATELATVGQLVRRARAERL